MRTSDDNNIEPRQMSEVLIFGGLPMIVPLTDWQLDTDRNSSSRPLRIPQMQFGQSVRNEYELLNDPRVMILVCGTYDTYKCVDCNIVLSGYKRGDPGLNEHVHRGGGECRYIKTIYRGREKELLVLRGKLRFQQGLIAFPEFLLYSNNGYVNISGVGHCSICTCPFGEDHYIACEEIRKGLRWKLKNLKVKSINDAPLFKGPEPSFSLCNNIESDSSLVHFSRDFTVLGESANMCYRPQTLDTHVCFQCHLSVQDFVQNDTLLGEHIYHVYNEGGQCPYLEDRFKDRKHTLVAILGMERFRKGSIAFPDSITDAVYGCTTIGVGTYCLVCSAMTVQGIQLRPQGHHPHCEEMTKSLTSKLKNITFIM